MSEKPLHVIVIGAGLAGLTIAQGLKKNGVSHVIVDRETAPRGRNWGITLSWADPLFEKLLPPELYTTLQACQPDKDLTAEAAGQKGILIRDGSTGKAMTEAHMPLIRRMQIQKTKKHLAQGLNIKYGKKLTDITTDDSGVTAHFEDGTSETGNVVIGADGGASRVRRWLLGEVADQEVMPYAFMNFPFTLPAEKAVWLDKEMNPNVDASAHPKNMYIGLFLLDKPIQEKPETWIFYLLTTWPLTTREDFENTENRLERLRARMDGWADPYKSVVEWLPDDIPIGKDQLRIWHTKPWDNHGGKVTLAGDAAHSMTFHRGQGGNLAIKDADEFVTQMIAVQEGKLSPGEALKQYDEGVVERGKEVAISTAQTDAFHDYANFKESPVFKMGIRPAGGK
ncbi:FAD/NAD(P)-binding domain-containing protein [Rhizodiscina lignyota]|uniref:FAD/NAD(P)-binding domain-containing protein n=1 Tax=Rhizodiscina lignyota TaxID=1504668 RepID=A0A9P4IL66_9PEZI|nr:FAD/NAD(P)-binding domain-containing protein [Rhizodiscina lignyota]